MPNSERISRIRFNLSAKPPQSPTILQNESEGIFYSSSRLSIKIHLPRNNSWIPVNPSDQSSNEVLFFQHSQHLPFFLCDNSIDAKNAIWAQFDNRQFGLDFFHSTYNTVPGYPPTVITKIQISYWREAEIMLSPIHQSVKVTLLHQHIWKMNLRQCDSR